MATNEIIVDYSNNLRQKNPTWVIVPLALMAIATVFLFIPWMHRVDLNDSILGTLCFINVLIWWIVLWWALHHLTYRVVSLFHHPASYLTKQQRLLGNTSVRQAKIALLYPTRDDFQWASCASCVTQDYPPELFQVVICDDSEHADHRSEIEEFLKIYPHSLLLRRGNQTGFKAGNLNYALNDERVRSCEWAIIVDADQNLPQNFVTKMSQAIAIVPENVAYIQGRQISDHMISNQPSKFQLAMGQEIDVFYTTDMILRESSGFLPMIGHGVALRHSAWQKVNFPEVVSEDFALSVELRNQDYLGVYSETIFSWEAFPPTFSAFLVRFRKFAGGTAELYRQFLKSFLFGRATFTEKIDFLMIVGWYLLMPLILLNGFLSAYVCHRLWEMKISALHPFLPYVFISMALLPIPVIYSVTPTIWHAIQHWFWTSAVYGACLPLASLRFLTHLILGKKPHFDRTPKDTSHESIDNFSILLMVVLGAISIGIGYRWYSPFSPILFGMGISYVCFPLYPFLNSTNMLGVLARLLVFLPGVLYLYALWEMWRWQGL